MKKNVLPMKRALFGIVFIFAIISAMTSYVNSTFLTTLLDEKIVGLVFSAQALVAIGLLAILPRLMRVVGNVALAISLVAIDALCLYTIATSFDKIPVILAMIGYMALSSSLIFSFDIFMEHSSKNKTTGGSRGLYLTVVNAGWLISPFVAGYIVDHAGLTSLYSLAFILLFPILSLFLFYFRPFKDKVYKRISFAGVEKILRKNKNIRIIFIANFLLNFFYALMVIYTPLYLSRVLHFSWEQIGIIFTIMLVPFVLLDFPLGKIADNGLGEKELLRAGFLIAASATLLFILFNSTSVLVYGGILFLTRVGAAMIETMNETYFFKQISDKDSGTIAFFRNLSPIAFVVAPIFGTAVLYKGSYEMLYISLSVILLSGFFLLRHLKDTN